MNHWHIESIRNCFTNLPIKQSKLGIRKGNFEDLEIRSSVSLHEEDSGNDEANRQSDHRQSRIQRHWNRAPDRFRRLFTGKKNKA